MEVPVIGGKVSFYNETSKGPIKPSPVIGTLGLVDGMRHVQKSGLSEHETIFLVGATLPELGGSEYYEYIHKITGGTVPVVDMEVDKRNGDAVLKAIRNGIVSSAHDCSKGGLGVALSEMAILGEAGLNVDLSMVPSSCSRMDELLFSESNSRYLVGTKDPEKLRITLSSERVTFTEIGKSGGNMINLKTANKPVARISLPSAKKQFYYLEKVMR